MSSVGSITSYIVPLHLRCPFSQSWYRCAATVAIKTHPEYQISWRTDKVSPRGNTVAGSSCWLLLSLYMVYAIYPCFLACIYVPMFKQACKSTNNVSEYRYIHAHASRKSRDYAGKMLTAKSRLIPGQKKGKKPGNPFNIPPTAKCSFMHRERP